MPELKLPAVEVRGIEEDLAIAYLMTAVRPDKAVAVVEFDPIPSRPNRVRIGGRKFNSIFAAANWVVKTEATVNGFKSSDEDPIDGLYWRIKPTVTGFGRQI